MDSPESVNNIGDIGDLENQGVLIMPVFNSQKVCIFYINPCLRVILTFIKILVPLDRAIDMNIIYGRSTFASRHSIQSQDSSDRRDFHQALEECDILCGNNDRYGTRSVTHHSVLKRKCGELSLRPIYHTT